MTNPPKYMILHATTKEALKNIVKYFNFENKNLEAVFVRQLTNANMKCKSHTTRTLLFSMERFYACFAINRTESETAMLYEDKSKDIKSWGDDLRKFRTKFPEETFPSVVATMMGATPEFLAELKRISV